MKLCLSNHPGPRRAMTIPELMVAVAVAALILTVMAIVFTTSARSFAFMGNYTNMNREGRRALDHMTREIRQAGDLTSFAANRLVFTKYGTTNSYLVYHWDADTRELTEWKTGSSRTNILLTDCEDLAFTMHKTSFAPTTVLSEGKGIKVSWKCSRTTLGKKYTSEDMGQALIVMRNKPI